MKKYHNPILDSFLRHAWSLIMLLILLSVARQSYAAEKEINYSDFYQTYAKLTPSELCVKGYECLKTDDIPTAQAFFNLAAGMWNDDLSFKDKVNCIISMNNIGSFLIFHNHNPQQAYPWLAKALDLARKENASTILPVIYDNLAKIYDDFGDIDRSMAMYRDAYNLSERRTDRITVNKIFNDLASTAVFNHRLDSVREQLKSQLTLPVDSSVLSSYSHKLAEGLEAMLDKRHKDAADILTDATSLVKSDIDQSHYLVVHYIMTAYALMQAGEHDKAAEKLRLAETVVEDSGIIYMLPKIYASLEQCFRSSGDVAHANHFRLRKLETRDSLYDAVSFSKIKELESAHEIDKLNKGIAEANIRHAHRMTLIRIIVIGIVIIIALLIFLAIKNHSLGARNKKLVLKNEEANERQRIDRQLRLDYEERIERLKALIPETVTPDTSSGQPIPQQTVTRDRQAVPLTKEEIIETIRRIKNVTEESQEVFSSEFTLDRLAEITGCKPAYLSYVINTKLKKNFNTLIGEARIRKACELLIDDETAQTLTLDAIAEMVGYKSRSHFSAVFKKITGVAPSRYAATARSSERHEC